MKKYHLNQMTKGWFVGNFYPTIINTDAIEIGIKYYPKNFQISDDVLNVNL